MRRFALLILMFFMAGCDVLPKDAAGSLERLRAGGPLRAGWSPAEPWVRDGEGAGAEPRGIEPDLIRSWAALLGARVEWVPGSEGELVRALGANVLDVAVLGLTRDNPWGARIGSTQPYLASDVVLGVPAGETLPREWRDVPIAHHPGRPGIAALIRGLGAAPRVLASAGPAAIVAAYAPEVAAMGLRPVRQLARQERIIATAPGESALTLHLDRFLQARKQSIGRALAEARP